jgi:hypothetical protein
MAVMTLDEDLVSLLARSAPDVGEAVLIGPDARQFEALCDKAALDATARAAGVGRPAAVVVHGGEPEGPWPPLPSVVKPRASADVPVELNRVAVVATAAERDEHVRRLAAAGVDAVVEERIHGAHWTVHCVRWDDGGFAGVTGRILRTAPRAGGMPEAARRLLQQVGYRGFANVQLFERGGTFLVHDVNLRPPAPVALAIRAGFDLPRLGLEAAMGAPGPDGPGAPLRLVRYVSLMEEIRGLAEDVPRARLTSARRLALAAAGLRSQLDPPVWDPLWVPGAFAAVARRLTTLETGRREA